MRYISSALASNQKHLLLARPAKFSGTQATRQKTMIIRIKKNAKSKKKTNRYTYNQNNYDVIINEIIETARRTTKAK